MSLNLNDYVTVVPTAAGAEAINGGRWSLGGLAVAGVPYSAPLWQLMSALGPRISAGGPQLIERNSVEVRRRPTDIMPLGDPHDWPGTVVDADNDGPRWRPTRDDLTADIRASLLYAAEHGHAAGPVVELRMWRTWAPLLLELAAEATAKPPSPATRP